jgi:hypothetical protein
MTSYCNSRWSGPQYAVELAERLIAAAGTLLGQLSFFAQPGRAEP